MAEEALRKKSKARSVTRRYIKNVIVETAICFQSEAREVADQLSANRDILRDEFKEIKAMNKDKFD